MTVEEYCEKYGEHHAQSEAIARLLLGANSAQAAARGDRMLSCGTVVDGYVCEECGQYHVRRTSLCRDRLCPNCGYVLTRRRAGKMYDALRTMEKERPLRVSHATLTLPHTESSDLRGLMKTLTQGYGRMVKPWLQDGDVLGTARGIEITHEGSNGFHPHIHALVVEDARSAALQRERVLDAWRAATGIEGVTQVAYDEAYDGTGRDDSWAAACLEAVKYAIKPGALLTDDEQQVLYFADAVRGFRLHSTDGMIRAALRDDDADMEKERRCAECHSDRPMDRLVMRWNHVASGFEVIGKAKYGRGG